MEKQEIGEVTNRTSTTDFNFIVRENSVKKWDYIEVIHPEVGSVLAQVTDLEKKDSTTVATCIVIGKRTERGFLRKPKTPIEPKSQVYYANDKLITENLGLSDKGLYVGLLEGRDSLKVRLDAEKLIKKHLAILAKTGAGKSYALGVIIEELAELGIPILIVDPHGEYSSIKGENTNSDDKKYFELYDIKPGAIKNVKEFSTDPNINVGTYQLKLPIPQDPFTLIQALPSKISDSQKRLLYSVVKELKETRPKFTFVDLIESLEIEESSAKLSLMPLLQDMKNSGIFSFNFTSSHELITPGQVTILNLRGAPPVLQETIVQVLVTTLFEERKLDRVPPFFLIIEESHNFMPERGFGEAKSSHILRTVASEGRKFGLGLAMVSQRPARIDKNVLSQANSQVILQVTNPNDLKAISRAFEGVSTQVENEIKALPIGRALVIGASDYPVFVDIRVRKTQHGGRSKPMDFSETASPVSQNNLIYGFNLMVDEKDVVKMEEKDIAKIRILLQPNLFVNVSKSNETYHVLASLTEPAFYKLENKLEKIKIPSRLGNLSPAQRKVLAYANGSTIAELFMKTGLSFNEVNSIANNLQKEGLVKINNNRLFLSDNIKDLANLEKLNFFTKPTHINLEGKKIDPEIAESQVFNWIRLLGGKPVDKRIAYLPFYHITFQDGSEKTMDVLSYSISI